MEEEAVFSTAAVESSGEAVEEAVSVESPAAVSVAVKAAASGVCPSEGAIRD